MQTAITTAIRNIPGPPERPKSSGECWFTRCGRGCRAGRPWEDAGHRVASAFIIQRRRPTGCRSGQANSPNVSQPQAHPRATTGSFCRCHAISRATGMSETRTRLGFRRFFICPSLFRGAVPLNAVYLNSPARSPRQYEVGTDANGMVGAERRMFALKCDQKRRISELRSDHQTKVAGRHAKRRAIHEGRGSILKCGVSGVIVAVLKL